MDEINSKMPNEYSLNELQRIEDKTPFAIVALQEKRQMNMLIQQINKSLNEMDLLIKVSGYGIIR